MADETPVIPPAALLEHPDPSATVNGSIYAMLAIATLFLALRMYCKTFHNRWMMWTDDYLLLAGWVFIVISHALTTKMIGLGFGTSLAVTPAINTFLYIADNTHKVGLGLTKTSFAVTLLRISTGWQVYVIWFVTVSMNIQFAVHIILTWRKTCSAPIDETPYLPVSCWEANSAIALGLFGGFYSALSDFVLALLPWKIIMGLNMKKHERIGVAAAMSIGVLAGVTGIMKATWSIILLDIMRPDYPWHMAIFWIWVQAEPNAAIIAASIPTFRVLLKNLRSSRKGTYPANQYIKSDNMSKFHNRGTVNDSTAEYGGMDAGSEHSILPQGLESGSVLKGNNIVQTREVTVEYTGSDGKSDDIELERWQASGSSRPTAVVRSGP